MRPLTEKLEKFLKLAQEEVLKADGNVAEAAYWHCGFSGYTTRLTPRILP